MSAFLIYMDDTLQLLKQIANTEMPPEQRAEIIARLAKAPPNPILEALARDDSPEGFFAFCERLDGAQLPKHNQEEVRAVFRAHESGMGFSLNGWRGSFKSTTLSVKFLAWRIGLEPTKTHLVISANDDNAEKITKLVAAIIEVHPAWKAIFPSIVPVQSNWSVTGYWVWDNRYSEQEWAEKRGFVIDPSFVGGGWNSTRINGKHPSGCLISDDLQSKYLTDAEQKNLLDFVFGVILKMPVRKNDRLDTWVLFLGVQWPGKYDIHQALKDTGFFVCLTVPAMKRSREGVGVFMDGVNPTTGATYEDIKGWWILTEPERFGVNSILAERAAGKFAFWQMIMMDIQAARSGGLPYYSIDYTAEQAVLDRIPVQGGVDPSDTDKAEESARQSSFSLAYIGKLPMGGAVVLDGVIGKKSVNQGAAHIADAQVRFPGWIYTAVENTGVGRLYIKLYREINPQLRILPSNLNPIEKVPASRHKEDRIRNELAPWFENMRIRISSERTEFLDTLRYGLDNFVDLIHDPHNPAWDVLDSVYHAVKAMPDVVQTPKVREVISPLFRKEKSHSPIWGMGKQRGY